MVEYNLTAIDVVKRFLYDFSDSADNEYNNEVGVMLLNKLVEMFGIHSVAHHITTNPNKGYRIRYLDDFSKKMDNERYQNLIKENEEKIKQIINKT